MKLLAIDPGTESSGIVMVDIRNMNILGTLGEVNNFEVMRMVSNRSHAKQCDHLAIEMIASYGMPVGASTFETCLWIGRFIQAWVEGQPDEAYTLIYRGQVKDVLCNSRRAKDANIRQALLDRYPPEGGGKTPQIGTKKEPGPLYGVKKHAWSALAVAHAWERLNKDGK